MCLLRMIMNYGLVANKLIKKCPSISVLTLPSQAFLGRELKKLYDEGRNAKHI